MAVTKLEITRETPTHWTVLLSSDDKEVAFMISKLDFSITIPYFEFMYVPAIVNIIAELCSQRDTISNPVVKQFWKFIKQSHNKEEFAELQNARSKL